MSASFVTGAGGFVAAHLIRRLLARGDQVVGGVYGGSAPEPGVLTAEEITRVRWTSLDVTSPASLHLALEAAGPDEVYHLAGQSSVGGSFADPMGTWEVNATGTLRLLEAARAAARRPRVLVISSAEVYGDVPEDRQPICEDEPLGPITPYGASKMAAEAAAFQAAGAGMEVVIARSFNHAGAGQDARFALPSMARQLVKMAGRPGSDRVLHVGNLEPARDFLDVRDVAAAYTLLMARGESGGVYNVASGRGRTMREIVETLVRVSGSGARIEVDPDRVRAVDIPLLVGSSARLRALGWAPEHDLEATMRAVVDDAARSAGGA